MTTYHAKRVYEKPTKDDGYRVLVDRVWPRGVRKDGAKLDQWAKEIAPSTELRKWFSHDPDKFETFKKRYKKELSKNDDFKKYQKEWSQQKKVTFVFGAKEEKYNQAEVLQEHLNHD